MTYSLDHAVILVHDLIRAQADYRALGFTVVEGGRHEDGLTHNALVAFEDGSYLELIAFLDAPSESHPFQRGHGNEGLVTFALLPEEVEREVSEARKRGLPLEGPRHGGRTRPDGLRIEWQSVWPGSSDLPFLCADITSRDLRVPYGPARLHANGIMGVAAVIVLVNNIDESAERYSSLLGSNPLPHGPYNNAQSTSFHAGNTVITLVRPVSGEMRDYIERRGEGPYALTLHAGEGRQIETFDPSLTHGVELEAVPQGSDILGTLL